MGTTPTSVADGKIIHSKRRNPHYSMGTTPTIYNIAGNSVFTVVILTTLWVRLLQEIF